VNVVSKKTTPAMGVPLLPEDEGKGIVRIDGLVTRNAGVALGDKVEVCRANPVPAVRVRLAPVMAEGHKISFGEGIEKFVRRGLLKRPLSKGDMVIVPGIALMGGALPFLIQETAPDGVIIADDKTVVTLSEGPVVEEAALGGTSADRSVLSDFVDSLEIVRQAYQLRIANTDGEAGARARKRSEGFRKLLKEAIGLDTGKAGQERD